MANYISKSIRSLVRKRGQQSSTSDRNPIDRMGSATWLSLNEIIFCNGRWAKHIYKFKSGCIRTYADLSDGRRLVSAFYFPGDYFGLEMREKHNISAEAITPSIVLVIGRKALTSRAATDIAVAKHMLDITNAELQRVRELSSAFA